MPTRRRFLRTTLCIGTSLGIAGCNEQRLSSAESTSPTETDERLALPAVVRPVTDGSGQVTLRPPNEVVLVNFFTTWCKPCREEMPAFRKLRANYDREQLHMVSVTPEVDESLIAQFWQEYNGTWPVVKDPQLTATERWDADAYPTNLLFDQSGEPAAGTSPEVDVRSYEGFAELIDPLLEATE